MSMKSVIVLMIIFSLAMVGCTSEIQTADGESLDRSTSVNQEETKPVDWKTAELTDVRTGDTFTIADFSGKPVLVESFAVWCPLCTKQQRNIRKLHGEVGDSVVSISLNTDPNEDAAVVLDHVTRNNFEWRYVISPSGVTQSLIDEFGVGVVNAPSAPVILVCSDGSSSLLDRGVKSVDELKEAVAGC